MGTISNPLFPEPISVWRTVSKRHDYAANFLSFTTIFVTTGDVLLKLFGVCRVSLTRASLKSTLVTGASALTRILPVITDGRDLIVNEIWQDATPTETVEATVGRVSGGMIASAAQVLQASGLKGQLIRVQNSGSFLTGIVDFYCTWKPLSVDGNVVAA